MAFISFSQLDPVEGIATLQREIERFLRRPLGIDLGPSAYGVYPPINVFADKEGLVARAEVPGVAPASISVRVERRTLTISGERLPESRTDGSFHRRERRFGKFSRSLQLPEDLDTERASAECRNGLLTVRIPRRPEAQPRQIQVQAS